MHIYNKENTDTVIDPIRIFPKAFHFANINQNTYLGGRKHKKMKLTWLWEVLVTPHTVVTTDKEPGGWLVFCCQGTES